jgi:ubiquinol-cytochrome c reductase cytochrome b subunit
MKRRRIDVKELPAKTAGELDDRFQAASLLRRTFNKVFPDHWSFLLGEIALYSFVVLLLTGVFLTLWFDPSMQEVKYNGVYTPLKGIEMSKAYESSLTLSFEVRGGLIMRQMHHWAALLFMAAIVVHMLRIFFTGAFRKPREANWIVGVLLFWLGFVEGFGGYSLPDDALSGTGLRIAHAIMMSIPVVGTWVATSLFGGEFPGHVILGRLYILHVLLVPAILVALITVHMALLVKQKHTQWPGPGRTEHNVVGVRMFPGFAAKAGGFFMIVFGVIALLGEPARLVRDVPGRLDPSDAAMGGPLPAVARPHVHVATAAVADGRAARHPDHAAAVLPVHRGPVHQGQAGAPPVAAAP